MIVNADNVIRFELSLHDGDDFATGKTVPASVRRLSDDKFLTDIGTWDTPYNTIDMGELTGNNGVEGRYFLELAVQGSDDVYMFRALYTFAGESLPDVWEIQVDAESLTDEAQVQAACDAALVAYDAVDNTDLNAALAALNDMSPAELEDKLQEVFGLNATTNVMDELTAGAPVATPKLAPGLMFLYMALRNLMEDDGTEVRVKNDAGATIAKAPVSDAASTLSYGQYGAP